MNATPIAITRVSNSNPGTPSAPDTVRVAVPSWNVPNEAVTVYVPSELGAVIVA